MVKLTDAQQKIRTSLITAISNDNLQTVQDIFNNNENEYDDIQAVLRHKGTPVSSEDTILDLAIVRLGFAVEAQAQVKIIKRIWKVANQETRDFVCCRAIDSFREFNLYNIPGLETVIQEMEEHKRVMDHIKNFHVVLESLDSNDDINWEQIGEALDFGNDQEKVFTRLVESSSNQNLLRKNILSDSDEVEEVEVVEVVKVIKFFEFLYQKTPEKFRQSLFGLSDNNKGGFTFLFRNSLENLKGRPELHKLVNDFIQKIDEGLNEYASKKLIEEQGIEDAEHIRKLKEQETETPEKNDTNFLSKHKGKIALGVVGLCVAGAIAAYVLAYPAVALALAVLAAVILMGAGIAKVLEDPSVEKPFTQQQEV